MKQTLLLLSLILATSAFAQDQTYDFTTDFSLIKARMVGDVAVITVKHKKTFDRPKFVLSEGSGCAETFPQQCGAVLVRIDQNGEAEEGSALTNLRFNLVKKYGKDTEFALRGPNGKVVYLDF